MGLNFKFFVEQGLESLLENESLKALKVLYDLQSKNIIQELITGFGAYLEKKGKEIIALHKAPVDSLQVASKLMGLKRKSEQIICQCFSSSKELLAKEKESFENLLTAESLSISEWLAHCFHKIQKQKARESQAPADQVGIDDLMVIFRFSSSKDAFLKEYLRLLSYRLIQKRIGSIEQVIVIEDGAIKKLSHECGHVATGKLTALMADFKKSIELKETYARTNKRARDEKPSGQTEFTILTSGKWPIKN